MLKWKKKQSGVYMNEDKYIVVNSIIEIEQPVGVFLVAKMKASELLSISFKEERYYSKEFGDYIGIQRHLRTDKIKSLQKFINTNDATFPNTIIGSLDSEFYEYNADAKILKIKQNKDAFKIIDGQHRLMAFENQPVADSFELLVAFFLDIDLSDQAYIFSIINTTQSKLDPSLVQDLSELSEITTPEKIAHSIAKVFNKRDDSPWYQMIKLLGKRDSLSSNAIISQYSFNRSILNYMYDKNYNAEIRNILKETKDARINLKKINIDIDKFIFWNFYVHSEEGILYLILNAYFSSLKEVFTNKWCKQESILCKTTGYDAFMKLFRDFYFFANKDIEKLKTKSFYTTILNDKILPNIALEDESYRLGAAGAGHLYKKLSELFHSK